jgi:hypothetical protein
MNPELEAPAAAPVFDRAAFCAQPSIRNAAPAKIALLRGPIYSDDSAWSSLMQNLSAVERFFAEIGGVIRIDERDGFAMLEQASEEMPGGTWPKFLYRDRFSYDVTCVLVVMREWLLTQEMRPRDERAPLSIDDLLTQLRPFSRKTNAPVEREKKRWLEAINKVIVFGLAKRWGTEEALIVRPIVRAIVSIDTLKELQETLTKFAGNRGETTAEGAVAK